MRQEATSGGPSTTSSHCRGPLVTRLSRAAPTATDVQIVALAADTQAGNPEIWYGWGP
jgi:hypothetical protein